MLQGDEPLSDQVTHSSSYSCKHGEKRINQAEVITTPDREDGGGWAKTGLATFPSILTQNDCAAIKAVSYFCDFLSKHMTFYCWKTRTNCQGVYIKTTRQSRLGAFP